MGACMDGDIHFPNTNAASCVVKIHTRLI